MPTSIKKNFAFNSAYQILNVIVPLITTPYLSRTIGASGNGVFTYTQSIANYFVLFAQLGITNYGVREIASCRDDRKTRSETFWNLFAMNLVVGIVVTVVYFLYAFTIGASRLLISLIWSLWVIGSVVDVTWLLNGCQEFKVPMVRNFCTRLAGMCFIFAFVHTENDTWAYVFAISLPYFINALLVWPFVQRYVNPVRPTWTKMLKHLKPNFMLFIPVIATSLYTLLDKVMLGGMAGMEQTGFYDYAEKISKMPLAIITALGAVVLPKMTEVIASDHRQEAVSLVRETMWFMQACAMALTFGIIAVAPEFVPIFFGAGYEECIPLMGILVLIIPLICASNVIGIQYLVPSHRDRGFTVSVLAGAGVNILINLFAIPTAGAIGTAFATVAAEASVLLVQAQLVRGELPLLQYLQDTLPFALIGIGMLMLIRAVHFVLVLAAFSAIVTLLLEILIGGFSYLTLSFLYCRATRNPQFARLFPRLVK
jgi:O-antigen/teichoic acid export membrane protein